MDDKTLAAFRASGEKDLATFLAKQGAQSDLPPGVGGYSSGAQSFAGTTSAERGATTTTPSFRDRINAGFARLSGLPAAGVASAALQAAGAGLGILAPSEPKPVQNVLTASRSSFDAEGYRLNATGSRSTVGELTTLNKRPALATTATAPAVVADSATPATAPAAPGVIVAADSAVAENDARFAEEERKRRAAGLL